MRTGVKRPGRPEAALRGLRTNTTSRVQASGKAKGEDGDKKAVEIVYTPAPADMGRPSSGLRTALAVVGITMSLTLMYSIHGGVSRPSPLPLMMGFILK